MNAPGSRSRSRRAARQMRLTAGHVEKVHRLVPDPGPVLIEGYRPAADADFDREVLEMLRTRPQGPFWLFGYGSLIWKPETAFTESRMGQAHGWHRRFCLGWDYRYRGCRDSPGLMMALDRGGTCKGMLYAIPESDLRGELDRLIRREMSMVPSAFPWRWIDVKSDAGTVRALAFAMNRRSGRYVAGLSDSELAKVLATAYGFRGTMVEYLHSTVSKLQELGIHDRNLWRLQEMVAEHIDAAGESAGDPG